MDRHHGCRVRRVSVGVASEATSRVHVGAHQRTAETSTMSLTCIGPKGRAPSTAIASRSVLGARLAPKLVEHHRGGPVLGGPARDDERDRSDRTRRAR
jgi:hypothetical protein